jgi:hypothetical protein
MGHSSIEMNRVFIEDAILKMKKWLGTGDSIIQYGGVKLVSLAQTSPHSEMMRACKCFPQISSMSTLTHSKASSVCCLIFVQNIKKWSTLAPTYNSFTRHKSSHQRTTKQFEENLIYWTYSFLTTF